MGIKAAAGEAPGIRRSERETRRWIREAQKGNRNSRDLLVEQNLRLVWSIVHRYSRSDKELEDLFQIGCVGLLKAVDRFDLGSGNRFSTYAVACIMGEIRRYLRDDAPIHVSRSLRETAGRARLVRKKLVQSLGREPTVGEVAAEMETTSEELALAEEAVRPPVSLQQVVSEREGDPLLVEDGIPVETETETEWVDRVGLTEAIRTLASTERAVVALRYFQDKTQAEVAGILGLSQVQVSRLERRALARVRAILEEGVSGGG